MRRKSLLILLLICALASLADAQFTSGSTGADGALDLSTMVCPGNVCELQLTESGVYNFTTVNIPAGKALKYRLNSRNTPVIWLVQGSVNVAGSIDLNPSINNIPGPGGFYGGGPSQNGHGPGGGIFGTTPNGRWVGPVSLVPIIGGSGGASLYGGAGGGGAIAIASNTTITIDGLIAANGGNFYSFGAGGAIRLVANTINGSGELSTVSASNYPGGNGLIRIEAPTGQRNFTGITNPIAIWSDVNPVVIPTNGPALSIVSVAGYAVPSYSAGNPGRIDVMLPSELVDPILIGIQGANIPSGTQVQIQMSGASGTVSGCTLTGGPAPLSCTASATGLNRNGVSTLLAFALFEPPPQIQAFNPKGRDHVAEVRIETKLGGQPKFSFLRSNGTAIESKTLPMRFLQEFGM